MFRRKNGQVSAPKPVALLSVHFLALLSEVRASPTSRSGQFLSSAIAISLLKQSQTFSAETGKKKFWKKIICSKKKKKLLGFFVAA
jgi:hypothetical protein